MSHTSFARVTAFAACAAFAANAAAQPPDPSKPVLAVQTPALNEMVKWNLDRLRKDPFKLIKATPDRSGSQVQFVIEFTRRPEMSELFDWEHRGAPVLLRFLDEDGVALRTLKPRLEGELIPEKGARFRLILPMPDEKFLSHVWSIAAE
jgi:hypothetical protein